MKNIIIILYNDFETLDVFGPVEVLGRLKDHFSLQYVSREGGTVTSAQNVPVVTRTMPDHAGAEAILLIPGGLGVVSLIKDADFINRIKWLALEAQHILTVCTGSILFSKTGLLNGRRATSNKRLFNWAVGESPDVVWVKKARWVKDGNIYTSSGVSAGMDMTLGFVADTLGYDIAKRQSLEIEYSWQEDPGRDPFSEIY